MPTLETQRVAADNRALVRKIQKAVAFLAPTSVAVPETLFGADGSLIDLQAAGWQPIGMVSPDGYTFGRDVSKEEISALGYASAVRSDPTTVARSVSFTPIESHKRILKELQLGQDLAGVTQNDTTGELVIDHADLPIGAEYRLLVLGSDGPAALNWLSARLYPSTKLGTTGEESWGNEGAVSQQLTMDVFTDVELGTPCREFIGGTGAKAASADLGYTQAASVPTITSILPSGAGTGAQVTIEGGSFTGTTAIAFGAVNAPTYTVVDSTTIVVTVPSSTAGDVLVTVTNAVGTSAGFSYTRAA